MKSNKGNFNRALIVGFFLLIFVLAIVITSSQLSRNQHSTTSKPTQDSAPNSLFLKELRSRLSQKQAIAEDDGSFRLLFDQTDFPKGFYGFALVLYQAEEKRILVVRKGYQDYENMRIVFNRTMVHPRIDDFRLQDSETSRIQMDFILEEPEPVSDFDALSVSSLDANRFELGVDGLRISDGDNVRYFLPGDAFVRSILGKNQLTHYITKQFSEVPVEDLRMTRFISRSFVSYGDRWISLYRGYPELGSIGAEDIAKVASEGIHYVIENQESDGRFLYYYDAALDSFRDHEHPTRDPLENPYYNILRHSAGGLLLLYHFRLYGDEKVLPNVESAIEYAINQIVDYSLPDGQRGAYAFYNRKAKLGGSGLTLYLLAEYQRLTGDSKYLDWAKLLKNHLISEIRDSGEFYYYHIYPGREKDDRRSFSFYYPGEALIGLAVYYKYVASEDEKAVLQQKLHAALNFLLVERPQRYADQFTSLPSDSWLMMAINELWDIPQMRQDAYKEFVFKDADTMASHMYTRENALYPDYVGSFYYSYGNHPYPDGARSEGLMAAYELAVKANDQLRVSRYYEALKAAAWATLHLANTPASTYSVSQPDLAIGGIRFKLTRQWFRVDTIQHVAAFYLKFLPLWQEGDLFPALLHN